LRLLGRFVNGREKVLAVQFARDGRFVAGRRFENRRALRPVHNPARAGAEFVVGVVVQRVQTARPAIRDISMMLARQAIARFTVDHQHGTNDRFRRQFACR
jgi:hypothetical protein